MPYWMNIYFMDANSPVMEQMIFFHDHAMIIIFTMMTFLFLTILNLILSKKIHLNLDENQTIEMIWTILPMLLLIFIAIPSLRLLYLMEEAFQPSITLKVIGHQWYWSYEYPNFNLNFDSFILSDPSHLNVRLLETDNPVFMPMNSLNRLLITSGDVIHAWTVQSLGVKTDAVPGRLNQINLFSTRPGVYFGQCSEICGTNHSFMPISMKVSSKKIFMSWVMFMN